MLVRFRLREKIFEMKIDIPLELGSIVIGGDEANERSGVGLWETTPHLNWHPQDNQGREASVEPLNLD
jgi:hypothetical protein